MAVFLTISDFPARKESILYTIQAALCATQHRTHGPGGKQMLFAKLHMDSLKQPRHSSAGSTSFSQSHLLHGTSPQVTGVSATGSQTAKNLS